MRQAERVTELVHQHRANVPPAVTRILWHSFLMEAGHVGPSIQLVRYPWLRRVDWTLFEDEVPVSPMIGDTGDWRFDTRCASTGVVVRHKPDRDRTPVGVRLVATSRPRFADEEAVRRYPRVPGGHSRRHHRRYDYRRIRNTRLRRSQHGRDQVSHGVVLLVPSSFQRQVRLDGGRPAGRPGGVHASDLVFVGCAVPEVADDGLGTGDRDADVLERKSLPVVEPQSPDHLLLHLIARSDRDGAPLESLPGL